MMFCMMPTSERSSTPVRIAFTTAIRPKIGGARIRARMTLLAKRNNCTVP